MTVDEFMGRLAGYGFTVCRRGDGYLTLQGREGDLTGIPDPVPLTGDQRTEEMCEFMKRNMLS